MPTSLSLALPEFPAGQRATATALWTATGAVAAATGPVLGGVLVAWQGWRWVFFINLAIGLAALAPARRLLRESREPGAPYPDGLGAALLTASVAALALGIIKGPDVQIDEPETVARLVLSTPETASPSPAPLHTERTE